MWKITLENSTSFLLETIWCPETPQHKVKRIHIFAVHSWQNFTKNLVLLIQMSQAIVTCLMTFQTSKNWLFGKENTDKLNLKNKRLLFLRKEKIRYLKKKLETLSSNYKKKNDFFCQHFCFFCHYFCLKSWKYHDKNR